MLGYHLVPNVFLFATFSSIFFLFLDIICENDEKNGDANHRRTIKNSETNVKHVQAAWLGDYCDMTVEKKHWELWWWNQCLLGSAWVGFSNLKAIHENCNFSRKICNLCILDMKKEKCLVKQWHFTFDKKDNVQCGFDEMNRQIEWIVWHNFT